ncbi:PREDICTED: protein LHY-like isoform X3 [Tarenaya hassleriana]|uniref:protein LHY-like isoform X3 n=1 Tax=Tarenaya hassleriana TaxID=28532 RepID=UPI00053C9E0E|nr:PREDICTED: protein LHY-like isoform X3 [Tarenaya hassleriana]
MEKNISGEELVTKIRKPYTITKQRERWTEDEHSRFLEALRLYGRAWQRIEEHIGTKTAVQIRSHAQKFFTKLEKEAQAKGIPICQALDIEIPPPRPKRKPSNPYPRKTGNGESTSQVSSAKVVKLDSSASFSHCNQALDLEKKPFTEKPNGVEKVPNGNGNQDDNCSGVSARPTEAHCSSISSVNKYPFPNKAAPRNPSSFRESEPDLTKATADNGTSKTSNADNSCYSQDNDANVLPHISISKEDNGVNGLSPVGNMNGIQSYPWHFPVHVLNGNVGTYPQNPPGMGFQDFMFRPVGEVHGHSGLFTIPSTSATSQHQDNVPRSSRQAFPAFHPAFVPACHTQDDYRSFLQISSTFSNLIMSALLQNPAAHAAATFAASFWPYGNVGSSNDSSTSTTIQTDGAFPPRQMSSPPPSMAAITAATVAAATAWWAAHGLLPICAPFTCLPMSAPIVPPSVSAQTELPETDKKDAATANPQQPAMEQGEAQVLASPFESDDDLDENGRTEQDTGLKTEDHKEKVVEVQEQVQDSNTTQKKKQVDRSSCGSNTPSGSDVETDALEKAAEKDKEEDVKETDGNQTGTESSTRRTSRSKDNSSDSWKEVSEEGRMAFDALFARERLPQSFSLALDVEKESPEKGKGNREEREREMAHKSKIQDSCSKETASRSEGNGGITIGIGEGKSLRARRTGFKPYKRCSMEAKESSSQAEEKVSKRIRLDSKAST